MKKHEITFSIIKIPLDFIIILLSFFIAKELRLVTDLAPGLNLPVQTIENSFLLNFAIFGAILFVIVFSIHGLYSIKISNSKIKEFLDIIWYSIYFFMFFSLFVYLSNGIIYEIEIPRLIILFTTIIGALFIIIERIILNNIQISLLNKGIVKKRKILLINNKKHTKIKDIIKDIQNAKIYKIIGYINTEKTEDSKIKYLGGINTFKKLINTNSFDEILLIDSDFSKNDLYSIWNDSRIFGIRYRYITNYFDITSLNSSLSLINSIPVIEIKNTPLENWGRVLKRIFDIIGSIILIILFLPLMIITAIFIKIEEPNAPIIFKNKRVGSKAKNFYLYKFRYLKWELCTKEGNKMALDLEKKLIKESSHRKGPLYKIKNDPRKTKIGSFIEKYSIDELPQFFNVLIGNMSLVGPRPHQPREVKKYKTQQKRVLTIKPGITGMGQINGREQNTFDKEVKLDIFYIENWSFLLDLKILLKTIPLIINRK